jgi:asparagine synthase (glutamine-hydrolysing)
VAFAIWDQRRQRLFLSRDRLGVRPLFYTVAGGAFLFGSEVKSIFAAPGVSRALDRVALDQVFTFWVTLPPRTAFEGIRELPPGHSLTVQDGRVTVRRHWQAAYGGAAGNGCDTGRREEEYAEELRRCQDATLRLRSDVGGRLLSGGLDSASSPPRPEGRPRASEDVLRGPDDAEFDERATRAGGPLPRPTIRRCDAPIRTSPGSSRT